jgi:hypothetical protein
MKRLTLILAYVLLVLAISGCQSSAGNKWPVEVIVDGDGQFPDFIIGTWIADEGGWEFVFEPDGSISSAVISLGRTRIQPGRTTIVPTQLGGEGVYKPGLWTIQYSQESRELIVEIVIDQFHIELGDNTLHGRSRDFFIGSISKDGQLWWAKRLSFPEYVVNTQKYHDFELPFDPENNPPENLLFQKVPESE